MTKGSTLNQILGGTILTATQAFQSQEAGDLPFALGDKIVFIRTIDENWSEGKIGNKIGIYPSSFAKK